MENKSCYLKNQKKSNCYGCRACEEICPQKCISMIKDEETFLYPNIDKEKCISCGLCEKVCPINTKEYNNPKYAVSAVHKQETVVNKSSSGGAFSAICQMFENTDVVIFGALFDGLKVKHSFVTDGNYKVFCKSKYVQSDTNGSFSEVKKFLKAGKQVIFSGTPCQVAALKMYLGNTDREKLILIDLVCHGVPSQKLFDMHIDELIQKNGDVKSYTFKNKKPLDGKVNSRTAEVIYANGETIIKNVATDAFLKAYYTRLIYRPSCMQCQFAKFDRVSDITIADAWGIEQKYRELDSKKGVSLVIANTEKGLELVRNLDVFMDTYDIDMDFAINTNEQLKQPTQTHKNRAKFFKLIKKNTFEQSVHIATKRTICERIRLKLKEIKLCKKV